MFRLNAINIASKWVFFSLHLSPFIPVTQMGNTNKKIVSKNREEKKEQQQQ